MFGPCKVCVSKDARIADLKEQIAHLRGLVFPVHGPLPTVSLQADSILSGEPQNEQEEADAIHREAAMILSGNIE